MCCFFISPNRFGQCDSDGGGCCSPVAMDMWCLSFMYLASLSSKAPVHPPSSIVDDFKSYYRFYNNNAKHVLVGFCVCAFYTEHKIITSKQT